jgi:imidazole glycerol-phosphate synthase subunit HisH
VVNQQVQLIDAGTGNLQSVFNALQNLGASITVVSNAADMKNDLRTILPGVGAFRHFMDGLAERNMVEPILQIVHSEIPLLGICVGMQALFDLSEEMGDTPGLGIIPGKVIRFPDQKDYKVPHTGWNEVILKKPSPLFNNIKSGSYYYFNHSFYCRPELAENSLAVTDYILPFSPAVALNNVYGVQFHPEKSQKLGQQLLQNFLTI